MLESLLEALLPLVERHDTSDECGEIVVGPPLFGEKTSKYACAKTSNRKQMINGSLTCKNNWTDGVLWHNESYFIGVQRKSAFYPFMEPYREGWWHFVDSDMRVLLRTGVGGRIMDYTCSSWVLCSQRALTQLHIPATGICMGRVRPHNCSQYVSWSRSTQIFSSGFDAVCLKGWCVPQSCYSPPKQATLNVPANIRMDPPYLHHGLKRQGFAVAISWWSHGNASKQNTARVAVDLRKVDVVRSDYMNGSVPVSCPLRSHNYFVIRNQSIEPCVCRRTLHLSCE